MCRRPSAGAASVRATAGGPEPPGVPGGLRSLDRVRSRCASLTTRDALPPLGAGYLPFPTPGSLPSPKPGAREGAPAGWGVRAGGPPDRAGRDAGVVLPQGGRGAVVSAWGAGSLLGGTAVSRDAHHAWGVRCRTDAGQEWPMPLWSWGGREPASPVPRASCLRVGHPAPIPRVGAQAQGKKAGRRGPPRGRGVVPTRPLTSGCSRRPTASATLPLSGAADPQR